MIYTDAFDQPIASGDWIIYGASGYQRVAKIMDIKPNGNWSELIAMTATDKGAFKRKEKQWSRDPNKCRFYSIVRMNTPLAHYEDRIEKRLLKEK